MPKPQKQPEIPRLKCRGLRPFMVEFVNMLNLCFARPDHNDAFDMSRVRIEFTAGGGFVMRVPSHSEACEEAAQDHQLSSDAAALKPWVPGKPPE